KREIARSSERLGRDVAPGIVGVELERRNERVLTVVADVSDDAVHHLVSLVGAGFQASVDVVLLQRVNRNDLCACLHESLGFHASPLAGYMGFKLSCFVVVSYWLTGPTSVNAGVTPMVRKGRPCA